jgi:hypothetical protein
MTDKHEVTSLYNHTLMDCYCEVCRLHWPVLEHDWDEPLAFHCLRCECDECHGHNSWHEGNPANPLVALAQEVRDQQARSASIQGEAGLNEVSKPVARLHRLVDRIRGGRSDRG